MSVKWETKINTIPKLTHTIETLNGKSVDVGVNWANAWLANIHEYG